MIFVWSRSISKIFYGLLGGLLYVLLFFVGFYGFEGSLYWFGVLCFGCCCLFWPLPKGQLMRVWFLVLASSANFWKTTDQPVSKNRKIKLLPPSGF